MTIAKALERADELRPNPFSEEQKIRCLSELDGKIAREILGDKSFSGYDHAYDSEKELLLEESYCDIYLYYLTAMIDFFSRDYAEYNNSMAMFNQAYSGFAKAYQRGDAGKNPALISNSGQNGESTEEGGLSGTANQKGRYYVNIFT